MPLSVKLVVVGGEVKTAEIKLRLPSTIGRGRGTTIMLPHPLVSRTHCELYESDGRLMVRDLGSLNGTFINNQRVTEAPLPAGELLTVGTVTFRAVYETDDEPSGPPSGPAPVLRTRAQDTDPNGTIRANPPASSSSKTPAAPMDAEFNFGQPLVNFDDEDDTGPPAKPPQASKETARSEATVEELDAIEMVDEPAAKLPKPAPPLPAPAIPVQGKPTAAKPPAQAVAAPAKAAPAAKPAAAPKPAASAPATPAPGSAPGTAQKDAPTIVESKWKDSDDEAVQPADDDDDFNDFLKSLDTK